MWHDANLQGNRPGWPFQDCKITSHEARDIPWKWKPSHWLNNGSFYGLFIKNAIISNGFYCAVVNNADVRGSTVPGFVWYNVRTHLKTFFIPINVEEGYGCDEWLVNGGRGVNACMSWYQNSARGEQFPEACNKRGILNRANSQVIEKNKHSSCGNHLKNCLLNHTFFGPRESYKQSSWVGFTGCMCQACMVAQ